MTDLGQIWTLVRHQLGRRWRSLLIWGVALGATGALYVGLYPSMSGMIDDFLKNSPDSALSSFFGDFQGPISAAQWMQMEFLSLLIPLLVPIMVILIGSRTVAGDEERGNLDLLLGNPVRRWHLIVSSVTIMAIALTLVLALTWVITYVAVPIAGVDLGASDLVLAFVAIWPMALLLGTLALLLSTLVRRAFLANAVPMGLLAAMYIVELLAEFSQKMEPIQKISLFHYLGEPVVGDFNLLGVLLMLAGAVFLAGCAVLTFTKRDIYT